MIEELATTKFNNKFLIQTNIKSCKDLILFKKLVNLHIDTEKVRLKNRIVNKMLITSKKETQ